MASGRFSALLAASSPSNPVFGRSTIFERIYLFLFGEATGNRTRGRIITHHVGPAWQ